MDENPTPPQHPGAAKGDSHDLSADTLNVENLTVEVSNAKNLNADSSQVNDLPAFESFGSTSPIENQANNDQDAVIEYLPVIAPGLHPTVHPESKNSQFSSTVNTELAIDNRQSQLANRAINDATSPANERADTDQQVAISGKAVIQQALIKLLLLARREVLIVIPTLHDLFDDEQINQSLLDFVRDSPKRDVLILINNLADQQASNHQLIKLAQRISSRMQLKQTASLLETPVMDSDYLVVIDRTHILRIDDIEKYSAWFDINYPSRAQQYAASVLQQWPRAREIAEFRQIVL